MCGIFAILAPKGSHLLELEFIKRQSEIQKFRGPDFSSAKAGDWWGLGHVRLSIMDPNNTSANQPLSGTGNLEGLHVVHNGEIYNYKELYEKLRAEGHDVKPMTESDSEVVLHCYKAWGADRTAKEMRGMFGIVLIDEKNNEFFACRDHVGIKPLYHGWTTEAGSRGFSSELKCVHDQFTKLELFKNGHYMTRKTGVVRYWNPEWDTLGYCPVVRPTPMQIRRSLKEAVRKRMMAHVPYGAFLSGGIDSCIVTSLMLEIAAEERHKAKKAGVAHAERWDFYTGGKLKTFTVGMEGSPDICAARAMSKALGSEHYEHLFTPQELFGIIRKVVYHSETYEPELLRSCLPNYLLAKLARKHVKMVITGEGADEPFCGYQYFKDAPDAQALQDESRRIFKHLQNVNLQRADRMTMAHGLEARVPFLDVEFTELAMSVDPCLKVFNEQEGTMEKQYLRDLFSPNQDSTVKIPIPLLYRKKAMQCEGVGQNWVNILQDHLNERISDQHLEEAQKKYTINPPQSKEECYYRDLFEEYFPGKSEFIHVWEGGCRAAGASWKSDAYTRFGLRCTDSLRHGCMPHETKGAKVAAKRVNGTNGTNGISLHAVVALSNAKRRKVATCDGNDGM
eukprot:gnl/MRDRNA2_/MRDRNA2_36180_c0_seq1.p1 gnl/MRDRNA2_/MRDRNA2_36180_c0~~gnl/MRDRNA2_/MRDRNA2_36180_c0_seq1.p1  ORF type:complete len:621 (-),score=108.20 gnl/MRDRNA2_/MRDRNA2_36180_c0_seq1:2-1864(-)